MSQQFQYLFTPLQIGPITVRNRVLITAHTKNYAVNNILSDRHIAYYAERAKGGVGLIVTEMQAVHPTSTGAFHNICLGFDSGKTIPQYRKLSQAVHAHGGKVVCQVWHCGQHTDGQVIHDDWQPVWAPSPVPCVLSRETPHEMEVEEIQEVIRGFGQTARNIKEGGVDGVELHGAHSYGIGQFLSPFSNKRTDQYGGSLENRMRFVLEVIEAIRRECGDDFVLGIRISGDEFAPGGLDQEDMKGIAQRLEATGKVNYISVSGGTYHSLAIPVPGMAIPLGSLVYLAAGVKEAVQNIPVFTVARINDPIQAEKILADGYADMIGMTRANICDPELANKAKEGRIEDIRTCMACSEGCIQRLFAQRQATCVQNPAAGREEKWGSGTLKAAPKKKKVVVVGGGPAGMEAARVAALRGHEVVLYEKEPELGGQVLLAAKLPYRDEFGGSARFLSLQVNKLGVQVRLGTEATPELIQRERPDAVVVATGSEPLRTGFTALRPDLPGLPGVEQGNVYAVHDVIRGTASIGQRVVLIDDDGHHRSVGTGELLADMGKQVEILTRLPFVGMDIVLTDLSLLYQRLLEKGVILTPFTGVKEIRGNQVVAFPIYAPQQERTIEGVDTVVLAMGNRACNELYRSLKGQVKELYAVGDCVAPRRIAMAIYEGHKIGRTI